MKIRIIYIVICLMSAVLFSCRDNLELNEKDLEKYPWLMPFIQTNMPDFAGKHNMDLGTLEFSFQVFPQTLVLSKLDSIAQKEQWKVKKKSSLEREFSKVIPENYKEGETVLKVGLDTVTHRIDFRID